MQRWEAAAATVRRDRGSRLYLKIAKVSPAVLCRTGLQLMILRCETKGEVWMCCLSHMCNIIIIGNSWKTTAARWGIVPLTRLHFNNVFTATSCFCTWYLQTNHASNQRGVKSVTAAHYPPVTLTLYRLCLPENETPLFFKWDILLIQFYHNILTVVVFIIVSSV